MGKSDSSKPRPKVSLEKLKAMASQVRTGGKGSIRRKTKTIHHASEDNGKKVMSFIQSNQCHELPSIDEVDFIKNDNETLQFNKPKVFANLGANLTIVQGKYETQAPPTAAAEADKSKETQEKSNKKSKKSNKKDQSIPADAVASFDEPEAKKEEKKPQPEKKEEKKQEVKPKAEQKKEEKKAQPKPKAEQKKEEKKDKKKGGNKQ
ncbi:putative nascent polypeptide-associated complex subunit beta [Monocercomonoides exilis]|uniref:putative nascent polypeptide-associated complex subunit beta n=1 Tax=Monocercomonoides exilis TaxID=2049356 RepID=UPI00355ABE1F|nr:putative nascent polypeptide-associated complex subunit beta [Monocercomonoides exilis]|eukprot:MONOS_14362.1-p1 / transcript=MONOS_14362.1 / gene=MONOS_14362 / organism=Monocercomonoides_exilis_PA203 / gene_product=unspecified product / transcript_product=unspecified product / location=Mono_scaffold00989:13457-14187(+) / protein_length=205 / sequence_SO=supercontig / SO=protein_coding / is_pseudo=false